MVKKGIFRTIVPAALCVLLLGNQTIFLPAFSQGTPSPGGGAPHCHMHTEGFTPHCHPNFAPPSQAFTPTQVAPTAAMPTPQPVMTHHVWTGPQPGSIPNMASFAATDHTGAMSAAHHAFFTQHNMNGCAPNPCARMSHMAGSPASDGPHHFGNNVHQNTFASHNQSAITGQSAFTGNGGGLSHTFHFCHHNHDAMANGSNLSNQQTTNHQPGIGGYHAGYITHHGGQNCGSGLALPNGHHWDSSLALQNGQNASNFIHHGGHNYDSGLAQQNGQGAGAIAFHHHFHHVGTNNLLAQTGNNSQIYGQTTSHLHCNPNSQALVTLAGSVSASGSLLGSASLGFLNLDLSSNQASLRADISQAVMITVGGHLGANGHIMCGTQQLVTPGQSLTPAQYAAMEQVVTSGQQTLVLSDHGTAISGLITLVAGQVNSLSGLVVPTHVSVDTVGFTNLHPFTVSGLTQINGSLFTLQQTANVTAGINAGSLGVGGRGIISDSFSGLSLFNSFFASTNGLFASNGLTLNVINTLTNQGTITSVGTLNVSANQIANVGTPGHTAVMSGQNVNVYSASGHVDNSRGNIIAHTGNVHFNSLASHDININNTLGTIQALQGAIGIRDAAYTGRANVNVTGGDLLSKAVDIHSGCGVVTADVNKLTGAFNVSAGEAHVTASTDILKLGNIDLSGDPSFFNILGDVNIGGSLHFAGQNLAIVARNNIIKTGAGSIDTSSTISNGGNIIMIAGANVTNSSSNTQATNNNADTLTVLGGTSVGGYIDLTSLSALNSSSSHAGSNGGNITAVAYGGSGLSTGKVTLPKGVTVLTGGSGTGQNGSVNIIAGATSGAAISASKITTLGGTGGGGNITLLTQAPVISGAPVMTIKDGSIMNGAFYTGGPTNTASITTSTLGAPGSIVTIVSGGAVTTGAIINNGVAPNSNGGTTNITAATNAISNLQVNGILSANGTGTGNGGTINISYQNPATFLVGSNGSSNYVNGNISADPGAAGTTGGTVNITNTAASPLNVGLTGTISATGASPGNIKFTSQSGQAVNVTGSGALNGTISNNASAASVTYTSGQGDLRLGNVSNTTGNIAATANASNGNVFVTQNLTSAGTLSLNSGTNGSVVISNAAVAKGTSVNVKTPSFVIGSNNAALTATTGNLSIVSNGIANALSLTFGNKSSINALNGNVNFNNSGAPGAITTTTSSRGSINAAGTVTFNGGANASSRTVNVNVDSIGGKVIADGSSIALAVANGNLTLGALTSYINSSTGNITVSNSSANGVITATDFIFSSGSLTLSESGLNGSIVTNPGIALTTLSSTADITLSAKTINSAALIFSSRDLYLIFDNMHSTNIMIPLRDLNISSFTLGGPLTIDASTGLTLFALRDINFAYNNPSAITISGVDINATRFVSFNGGTHEVLVTANSIGGTIIGAGPGAVGGSKITIKAANGNLSVGGITAASNNMLIEATTGNITTVGNVTAAGALGFISGTNSSVTIGTGTTATGSAVNIFTSTLNLSGTAGIKAISGDVTILSKGTGQTLTINAGNGSTITSLLGNIVLNNSAAPGAITMTSGFGAINAAGQVILNGGTGQVAITALRINGLIVGGGPGNVGGSKINIAAATGNLTVGNLTAASNNMLIEATTGNITTSGNVRAAGALGFISGPNSSVTVSNGNTLTGAFVNLFTSALNLTGNAAITATQGDVTILSKGTAQALTINAGNGSTITSVLGNVVLNNSAAPGAITMTSGFGTISAHNGVGLVILNGGMGAVNINNQQIIGCIHVNGSSINIQTSVGDLNFCIGIDTSSTTGSGGNITLAANGGSVNGGAITSSGSGAGNTAGNISITGSTGINVAAINANGNNGASGGAVNLSSPGHTIIATLINATGNGGGNGGSVITSSSNLVLTGQNGSGNSVDVGSAGGTGGNITLTTTAPQPFVVGNGAGTGNGSNGNLSANGVNGGFIILRSNGTPNGPNQIINGQITANGTTGSGGKVALEVQPFGSATLTVAFNGGLVQATNNTNNSGRVGFNGGPGQAINLLGFGTINGGEFVHIGNLDRFTLEYLDPRAGLVTISPQLRITNNFSTNGFLASTSPASVLAFNPPYYPPTDFTPQGHFFYEKFQPKKESRFQLGLAYKRKTTAYIPGTKSYLHTFTGIEMARLANEGMTLLGSNVDNYLNIDKGNVLLSPDKNIVVGTHEGNVFMSPGAIAFVMESGHDVVVYNLRQSAPNQVSVVVGKHKIGVPPGNMLVLTRQNVKDFEDIDADCHMISYRGAQELALTNESVKAFVAQYSIASAFIAVEPLKQLIASNDQQDKAVLDKIVKSAVTLGDFSGTVDMEQLANLNRETDAARLADIDEKVIDSAKQMATKNRPIQ